jgi:hypothetical protein
MDHSSAFSQNGRFMMAVRGKTAGLAFPQIVCRFVRELHQRGSAA